MELRGFCQAQNTIGGLHNGKRFSPTQSDRVLNIYKLDVCFILILQLVYFTHLGVSCLPWICDHTPNCIEVLSVLTYMVLGYKFIYFLLVSRDSI